MTSGLAKSLRYAAGVLLTTGLITTAAALPATAATNQPPAQPTALTVSGKACSDSPQWFGNINYVLGATITDPDGDLVGGQFQWWPVTAPTQVTEVDTVLQASGTVAQASIATSQLTDGATYAWRVRGTDQPGNLGPWSATCEFSVDLTAPAVGPTISSTDYPAGAKSGGSGVPGKFTFGPNGVSDIVGYMYGFNGPYTYVAADDPDGPVTIRLAPEQVGPVRLSVLSVDKGGNYSPITTYDFFVLDNTPRVACTPAVDGPDVPRQCVFSPASGTHALDYRYTFDNGTETTLTPGADDTATITVNPTDWTVSHPLDVRADLRGHVLTTFDPYFVRVDPEYPTITPSTSTGTVGVPVTFTFQTGLTKPVSFTYQWNDGNPVTVPAAADGTASVTITPDQSGYIDLFVWATNADGVQSGETYGSFDVQAAAS